MKKGRLGRSGGAEVVTDKSAVVSGQLAAQLRNPAGRDFEAAGRGCRRFAVGKELGDATIAATERYQPIAEVELGAHDFVGACMAILYEDPLQAFSSWSNWSSLSRTMPFSLWQ